MFQPTIDAELENRPLKKVAFERPERRRGRTVSYQHSRYNGGSRADLLIQDADWAAVTPGGFIFTGADHLRTLK